MKLGNLKPLWILVADDSEAIQGLLWHWLTKSGHCVACVASGADAAKLLPEHSFDLLIADIRMPNGNGDVLMATFRQTHPSARILAISGSERSVDAKNDPQIARRYSADAVLGKPFTRDQLLEAVSTLAAQQ